MQCVQMADTDTIVCNMYNMSTITQWHITSRGKSVQSEQNSMFVMCVKYQMSSMYSYQKRCFDLNLVNFTIVKA